MGKTKRDKDKPKLTEEKAVKLWRWWGGFFLLLTGGWGLLSLSPFSGGFLTRWLASVLRFLFGWGAYPVTLAMTAGGGLLLWGCFHPRAHLAWETFAGVELFLAAGLALLHLLWPAPDPLALAKRGGGGGYVGWALSVLVEGLIGKVATELLFALFLLAGASLAFYPYLRLGQTRKLPRQRKKAPPARKPPKRKTAPRKPPQEPSPLKTKPSKRPAPAKPPSYAPERRKRSLPPLKLLEYYPSPQYNSADIRHKAEIIEKTLASFNIPARVVAINKGPVVTQFGIEPGYIERRGRNGRINRLKVKVSRITALADDLALALAAAPIRIEAPVPGRPYVGIEVPNDEPSLVSLREVMETREFRRLSSPLKIALGKGVAGQPVVADLTTMPHLLIAGATGSGKSVCINSIITCLIMQNPPEKLKLLLVDPKRVELSHFNGLPHLLAPVVVELEQVTGALTWLVKSMQERYHLFSEVKARHIEHFNAKSSKLGKEPLPYIVLVIDELADIMMIAPDETERLLTRLAQLSRATGIHLIIATQRPSVDVITGLIKANFPARISFAVTSQVDSRVVLDMAGAERLLGRGDMLFMPPDASSPIRLQGCFVSSEEIRRVVNYWQERKPLASQEAKGYPWEGLIKEQEEDELLDEAVELVKSYKRVSISLLQRKLHLGYPRAARLMDELEQRGVVTFDEDARTYRVLDSTE